MQLITVKIEKPDNTNFILGQTHFIKSVEDIHEALVTAVPGISGGRISCGRSSTSSETYSLNRMGMDRSMPIDVHPG